MALETAAKLKSMQFPVDCFRPWHASTFEQDAYQRIGIALQRGIISDQLARAHARRTLAEHGALPSGCDSLLYEGLSA